MPDRYFTLNVGVERVGDAYRVELTHSDPDSDAQVAPARGAATFDPTALLAAQATPAEYGRLLARQLFADPEVATRFLQVETAAQASASLLRVSLAIDTSAREPQALRWELLRYPRTDAPLCTSERVLLSRFMQSRDFRPVRLRAGGAQRRGGGVGAGRGEVGADVCERAA